MNGWLSGWTKKRYKEVCKDLCTCFIKRGFSLSDDRGYESLITSDTCMYISSFEKMRKEVIEQTSIVCFIDTRGTNAHPDVFDANAGWVLWNHPGANITGSYFKLSHPISEKGQRLLEALANPDCGWFYRADASSFEAIPGSPIAYWLKGTLIEAFRNERTLIKNVDLTASGNKTADNDLYIRYWYEVAHTSKRWVPLSKGGEFRKWYGNWLNVIDWSAEAKHFYQTNKTSNLMPYSNWFVEGVTWSDISSGKFHCRYAPSSVTSETVGPIFAISNHVKRNCTMALLNSSFADVVFELLAPGLHFKINDIGKLPFNEAATNNSTLSAIVDDNINLARIDWNAFEVSCGFKRHPLA